MSESRHFVSLPSPALGTAEIALNQYLGADPAAMARAADLAGRSLCLYLSDLGVVICFIAERHGIQVAGLPETEPDVRLTGASTAFARVFFSGGGSGIMGAGLRIEGDIGTAQQFADLFARVDFDLGDVLDARFGPVAGQVLARGMRRAGGLLSRLRRELPAQTAEYLREESRDAVGGWEHERFTEEVEAFRDQVERAAARVRRLERAAR